MGCIKLTGPQIQLLGPEASLGHPLRYPNKPPTFDKSSGANSYPNPNYYGELPSVLL